MSSHAAIRPATTSDLGAINDIYNHYVLTSSASYEEVPLTRGEREKWFAHHDGRHPVIVAEYGGTILGWGALSEFRSRSGYRFTVENSVYVHHDHQRTGIGAVILGDLIVRARALGYRAIIAAIDADQAASVALHQKFGFQKVAHLGQVGYKFGRWLDVVYMELLLDR